MSRRMYAGGAQPTALSAPMTNADTSLTVVSGTNYPDGSTGKAVLTIDAGLAGEEKVLYTSRTGSTFTGLTRGYDGTTAVSHSSGASVRHTISAVDLDEANAHINATANAHAATAISNTPAGGIASTTVQAALNELDTEKSPTTHTHPVTAGILGYAELLGGTPTTSSATPVDVSASLAVTFTAPASGQVLVALTAPCDPGTGNYRWTLTDTGGEIAFGSPRQQVASSFAGQRLASYRRRITGLTPGTSYTWKWAHLVTSGSASIFAGESATMEVWTA